MNLVTPTAAPQANRKSLTNTEAAEAFIGMASLDTGVRAMLGDVRNFDVTAGTSILNAVDVLQTNARKIAALSNDQTRTEEQRHLAGRKLSEQTVAQLNKSEATLRQRAENLHAEYVSDFKIGFRISDMEPMIAKETLRWIREMAKTDITAVRQALESDKDVASIVVNFSTKPFLLGVDAKTLENWKAIAVTKHLPASAEKFHAALKIGELAERYADIGKNVDRHFANAEIAARATASRVEI